MTPAEESAAGPRGSAVLDAAGRVLGATGAWPLAGAGPTPGQPWAAAGLGADAAACVAAVLGGARGEAAVDVEVRAGAEGEAPRRLRLRAQALPPGAGEARALVELEDVTASRRALDELRVCHAVVDRAPDAIAVIDPEGRYLRQNAAHRRLLGLADADLIGLTPTVHLGEETFARVASALARDGAFEGLVVSHPPDRDPVELDLSAFSVTDDAGRVVCHVGIKRDASARRRAEAALRVSEARFQRIAAQVPGIVYQFALLPDGSHAFPFVSDGARTLFGLAPEELMRDGARVLALIHPEDREGYLTSIQAAVAARTPWRRELRLALPDGRVRWIHADAAGPVEEPDGALVWSGVVLDVTDRRRVEEELVQARDAAEAAARAKSQFLANTSHELRTPLNAVIGMTGLLLDGPLTAAQRECAEVVRASAAQLLGVIDDVLDLSAVEQGRLALAREAFDPRACAQASVDLFAARAREKGLRLGLRVAADVPARLVGDEGRLRQVLVNLVGNAVKFTERGEVELSLEARPLGDGRPGLRLAVRDTGIGIPADRLDRLFLPFSQVDPSATRRFGGTGLGLALCRRLVDLLGGTIEVESAPGVGSTFRVALPVEPLAAPAPPAAPAADTPARPLAVLLVEDHPVNRQVALRMLAHLGHEAAAASTGLEALEALERRAFDVVLMDVHMPGMDGLEAARRLAARWPRPQRPWVVAMTAGGAPGDRERCLAAGMDDYLGKPVRVADLTAALARAAVRARAAAPGEGHPPAAPAPAAPALEGSNLAALGAGPAGAQAVAELVDLFLEDLPPACDAIRRAVTEAAPDALARAAHALKGSCGSLGVAALGRTCARLEAAGRAGALEQAAALLPALDEELARAGEALRRLRAELPLPG